MTTPNLNLTLPTGTDQINNDIQALATNFTNIDNGFGSLSGLIPTPTSTLNAYTYASYLAWLNEQETRQWEYGISVKGRKFGAVGDGTADDTTAIQNAINYVNGGGTVRFPKGTYKITTALNIPSGNIRLLGDGILNTFIQTVGSINAFNALGTSGARFVNILFEGMSLYGTNATNSIGINCTYSEVSTRNMGIRYFDTGIYEYYGSWNTFYENTDFINNVTYGVQSQSSNFKTFKHCRFSGGAYGGYFSDCNALIFLSTDVELCSSYGLRFNGVRGIEISGGYFERNQNAPFVFYSGNVVSTQKCAGVSIRGSFINQNTGFGVSLQSIDSVVIDGCSFSANTSGSINIQSGASNVKVGVNATTDSTYIAGSPNDSCDTRPIKAKGDVSVTSGATTYSVAFDVAMPVNTYSPWCLPNWNTTFWITAKTVSGFTLNFGTAAPSGALINWGVK